MQAIKIEKLYLKRSGFLLRDFNMELEVGQIHVITGKSGSGKSTLFRAIGGALRPEAGRILYYGKEMYEDELKIRKRMSVIYDAPNFNMEYRRSVLRGNGRSLNHGLTGTHLLLI